MDSSKLTQLNPWHDDEAIVIKAIDPQIGGRIRFHDRDWPARCLQNQTIPIGTPVRVIGHHRATWYVELQWAEAEVSEITSERSVAS